MIILYCGVQKDTIKRFFERLKSDKHYSLRPGTRHHTFSRFKD